MQVMGRWSRTDICRFLNARRDWGKKPQPILGRNGGQANEPTTV